MLVPRFSRRLLLVCGAGLSVALLLGVLVSSERAGAAGTRSVTSKSYTDVDYESLQPGTPDIKQVVVTRGRDGAVMFRLVFAEPILMTRDFGAEVFINADRVGTGDEDGWDYILDYSRLATDEPPSVSMFVHANGKEYEVTPAKVKSLRYHAAGGSVSFRVAAHDLGAPLAARLRQGHTIPALPKLGPAFTFDAVASADWLNDAAGADWLEVQTFPGKRDTGTSSHTEAVVLLWLVVGLVGLVVGQVMVSSLGSAPSSTPGVDGRRWDLGVFGATGAALGGMLASVLVLLPVGLVGTFVFHYRGLSSGGFWLPWLAAWSLVPCVVLGYLSGRWWSFLGAAPLLVLWPFGTVIASGPHDWFLTLPVTAAVAVALAFGSAVRAVWRAGGPLRLHLPLPT